MDKIIAYFETFHPVTNEWMGTATYDAASKAGLVPDLSFPMYGRRSIAPDGWACRAKRS
jgi:hypothetical protein